METEAGKLMAETMVGLEAAYTAKLATMTVEQIQDEMIELWEEGGEAMRDFVTLASIELSDRIGDAALIEWEKSALM
jgi:hypothetical protein